jgi:hypothetical protein
MGFELKRLVQEAAGAFGSRVADGARALGRCAHAQAGRLWRDVGEILRLDSCAPRGAPAVASSAARAKDPERRRDTPGAPFASEPPNGEPNIVVGARTQVLVETMAEVLERSGYRELRADVPNRAAPELVRGTVRSHRPSLAAVAGGCAVLVDVFVPGETPAEEQLSRWHLFSSAAEQVGGEFHVVVPATVDGMAGRAWARRVAEATGLSIQQVWEI